MVRRKSIQQEVFGKIGTLKRRCSFYDGLDVIKGLFFNGCPHELDVFLYHLLKGFNNFGKIWKKSSYQIDFPKKGLHRPFVVWRWDLHNIFSSLWVYEIPIL